MHERGADNLTITATAATAGERPDEALVAAARADRAAFDALYERYAARLYRYARARLDSDAAAEDVVADTMLAAMEGIDRYDPARGAFASWLFTIAARRVADRRRRRGMWKRLLPRVWEPEGADDDALTTVLRDADAARVRRHIRRLPERDREIVLLRYFADLNSEEIAGALGMTSGAVRTRLSRALQRLSSEMEREADR